MKIEFDDISIYHVYIGYYKHAGGDPTPLCISEKKRLVVEYLEIVRSLERCNYEIYQTAMKASDLYTLYGGLEIVTDKDISLPQRDWDAIYKETEFFMQNLSNIYLGMREYCQAIKLVKDMREDANCLEDDLRVMLSVICDSKKKKAIFKAKFKNSVVFTPDINIYLQNVYSIQEDRIMMNDFLNKVDDDAE